MQVSTPTKSKYPVLPATERLPPESQPFQPHGGPLRFILCQEPEVILGGPAGTGKSRAALEKIYILAHKHPGMRALMVRKTRQSLTQSTMVTFEKNVIPPGANVVFRTTEQEYRFPQGSVLVVGGLDRPTRIMSTEYDLIYVPEAIELDESDWEMISTRLRGTSLPYNQIMGDCNPGPPRHWIKLRASAGHLTLLNSKHKDNPLLYNHKRKKWTRKGKTYIRTLKRLSGVRYLRLYKGIWAAAEGVIYADWDYTRFMLYRKPIPPDWRRVRVVDFGFNNPFVCQWWAQDPEGNIIRYREIYHTKRTVRVHAEQMKALSRHEVPEATVCDHDAEGRATLEENGIPTIGAEKSVLEGIETVQSWLKAGRIRFLRDSLVELDHDLVEQKRPTRTEDEFDGYVWANKTTKEEPVKVDDHGMDALRYVVAYFNQFETGYTGGIHL